jgi:energy-coupling factor transport system permease protein
VHPDDLMRAAIKLRLPYRSVLVTSLSIRFVPVLMQDARTIADVQQSRGLSFDSGGIVQRIRNRGALILPLLSNSLDRAVQVAEAMESRAYGASVRRTFYRDLPPVGRDVALTVVLLAGIVLLLASRVAGLGGYEYYPSLGDLSMTSSEWVALGMLCAILLSVTIPSSPRGEECR